jgi:hypothetical protein
MNTASGASNKLFESIYRDLMGKAEEENSAIAANMKGAEKGVYVCGNWQRLLNDWCADKISNSDTVDYLQCRSIEYAGR